MFEPGQQFARFKIVRKLGEGGMGEVYLAEDQKLGREVALKILLAEFFDSAERLARFNREAKTAAQVTHPNVMAIYDIDTAMDEKSGKNVNYIVMEYIKGESLTDHLTTKSLSIQQLLRIAQKIGTGLVAAHKLNIIHRDIKTDNIRIDENGEPKILDFGLAKPVPSAVVEETGDDTDTASHQLTVEGKIVGTVTYMSPEQARGDAIDARSDIFSFGVLLYRMFSGEYPFEGSDRVSILAKILEGRQQPIRQKNEAIPAELERIIDKCLQKDPDDRYQDTRDLVVDLRSLRRQYETGISDTDSILADAQKPTKKRSFFGSNLTKIALALILTVVVIIVATMAFDSSPEDSAQNDMADLEKLSNIGNVVNEALRSAGIDPGSMPGITTYLHARQNALAILGFENMTGDTLLDWLEIGLPEILLTDLAQSGAVDLVSRTRILEHLGPEVRSGAGEAGHKEYIEAARSLGASKALSGSFIKLGDKIRIDARLEEIETGKIVLGEKVVGEDPFALVDSLTTKIAASLEIGEDLAEDTRVSSITSSSPEAYKQYILGMEKFAQFQFNKSIPHFEEAIEIDSAFALAYMRIGMAHALQGRQQGTPFFAKADQYKQNLPVKERNLLDIYTEVWLHGKFDDATTKAETFVGNYPDDKEARAFYAILLHELKKNTEGAIAQLDTVLMLDPTYPTAFAWYTNIYGDSRDYENVIKYAEMWKRLDPEVPGPYNALMTAYSNQGKQEEVLNVAEELLEMTPGSFAALSALAVTYTQKQDFDAAARYTEMIKEHYSDDPYRLMTYHRYKSNQAMWAGKFRTAIAHEFEALELARSANDSAFVSAQYRGISEMYLALGEPDSSLVYTWKNYEWATQFRGLDHPLTLVEIDTAYKVEAKEIFDSLTDDFKSRVPSEMWQIIDAVELVFEARCGTDTTELIAAFRELMENEDQQTTGNRYVLGSTLIADGQYSEGLELLKLVVSGNDQTTRGFFFIRALYQMGIAYEGLGNTQEAIANYEKVLEYWGDPEIEIREIADTRQRLGRLIS